MARIVVGSPNLTQPLLLYPGLHKPTNLIQILSKQLLLFSCMHTDDDKSCLKIHNNKMISFTSVCLTTPPSDSGYYISVLNVI
jgi:hypothetical protein